MEEFIFDLQRFDNIDNGDEEITVNGTAGADTITNSGSNVTINGGDGDDYIYNTGENVVFVYNYGDGNDTIDGFDETSTLQIVGGSYSTTPSEDKGIIVKVGDGSILLRNVYALDEKSQIVIVDDEPKKIENHSGSNTLLSGGTGDDTIKNYGGDNVTINGGAGNDEIYSNGDTVTIDGGAGNDEIDNNSGSNVTIDGGTGDDTITNTGSDVTIDGGANNDSIENSGSKVEINGGEGNDTIENWGSDVTINGGDGDDTIENNGSKVEINGGAGDNEITNSANDVTINTGEGNDTININGATSFTVEKFGEGDVITFGGKTVKLSSSDDDKLVAVVDGATVTIGGLTAEKESKTQWSDLKDSAATLVGNTTVTSNAYINEDGNIAYSSETTTTTSSTDLATLTGIASTEELSVGEGVITISADALDGKTVELKNSDGQTYKLALADGVDTKADDLNAWTSDKGNAIYFTGGKDSYYSLSDTKLEFHDSVAGDNIQVELSGANADKLTAPTKDVVTLTADSFSGNVKVVSNVGKYEFELAAGTYGKSFTGTDDADKITNAGSNITIDAGGGDDLITNSGSNVTIVAGGGKNTVKGFNTTTKLQIGTDKATFSTKESGDDLVVTYDGGTMTILDGKDNAENIIANILGTAINNSHEIVYSNTKKENQSTSATLTSDFEGVFDATQYRSIETIKVDKNLTNDIEIIGNNRDNKITSGSGDDSIDGGRGNDKIDGGAGDDTLAGGLGNDILTGGKGADTFIYDGKGSDIVTDYTAGEDTVQFDAEIKSVSVSGTKVIFNAGRYGSLTLDKAAGKKITYTDAKGTEITEIFRSEGSYSEYEDELKIFSTFSGKYDASKYKNLETIDGSAVKAENLSITGNTRDNSITGGLKDDSLDGGAGNDTLDGGKGADYLFGGTGNDSLSGGIGRDTLRGGSGDDTLTGGAGRNTFVYESGDDVITDFSAGINNRIQLLSGTVTTNYTISGSNLILNFNGGSLTIKDYDGNAVKFLDANGNESEYIFTDSALLNGTKTSATVASNSYTADNKILRIDGSQVNSVNIVGNWRNNTIRDSAGNDTLTGGAGKDFFVYSGGNDIITDYEKGDKIQLLSGTVTADNFALTNSNLILNFDSGSLTIQNYDGGAVKFADADGKVTNYTFTDDALMNATKTSATLVSGTTTFTADAKLATIDATNLSDKVSITGNRKANVIYGNNAGSSLTGGKGNDTLWGGSGADTFIFSTGDGQDVICNFNKSLDTIIRNGTDITAEICDAYNSSGKKSNFSVSFGGDRLTFKNFK